MVYVVLPELGEGIVSATVAFWHVQEGDDVAADQDVVEMVTDKATFNVPAVQSGKVVKILAQEGQEVKIGAPLVVLQD